MMQKLNVCRLTMVQSAEFSDYLDTQGIQRRLTVPYNLEQNGVVERRNRTLVKAARYLLIQ